MKPAHDYNAFTATVPLETVAPEHEPSPGCTAGATELGEFAGLEVGVWEMSQGVMHDTEADEAFVVIDGEATVEFLQPEHPSVQLRPGSVMVLSTGMRTRWTVHTPSVRKVYFAP